MLCLKKKQRTAGIFAENNLVFFFSHRLLHNLQSLYWAEAQVVPVSEPQLQTVFLFWLIILLPTRGFQKKKLSKTVCRF